jgi:AraC-like DNA-binding protein
MLSRAFRRLFEEAASVDAEPLGLEIAAADFFETLMYSQPRHAIKKPEAAPDSKKFNKAVDFIRGNFAENFSLGTLAAAADSSPFHLIRLFRRQSGLTPFNYLRSVRVERAKQFISASCSLTEVALRAGFYDQSHFIRSFKRHTGFLPSDFLR